MISPKQFDMIATNLPYCAPFSSPNPSTITTASLHVVVCRHVRAIRTIAYRTPLTVKMHSLGREKHVELGRFVPQADFADSGARDLTLCSPASKRQLISTGDDAN